MSDNYMESFFDKLEADAAEQPDTIKVPRDVLRRTYNDLDACQKVICLCGGFDPAYVSDAQARLKELEPLLFEGKS